MRKGKNRIVREKVKNNKRKFKIGKDSKNLTIENSLKVGHDKDGKIYVKGLSVKEAKDETSFYYWHLYRVCLWKITPRFFCLINQLFGLNKFA